MSARSYSPMRVVDPPCRWCGKPRNAHLGLFEQCPASRLRASFAREDALLAELARERAVQVEARNDYAAERGLLVRPSVAAIRKVLEC